MKLQQTFRLASMLALLLQGGAALAEDDATAACGPIYPPGQYGPYDYRTATKPQVGVVLGFHFNSEVEALRSGVKNVHEVGADLDYTLRALPNYARALVAMMKLGEREKTDQPRGAHYSVSCYFERALRFRPDDNIVRMLYADFLMRGKQAADAVAQLDYVASTADPENALTHYNLSLLYLDANQPEKAAAQALQAEALGKPIGAIRARLEAAGHPLAASDPASAPATPASASSASAAASR